MQTHPGKCQSPVFTLTLKEFHPVKCLMDDKNAMRGVNTRNSLYITLGTSSLNSQA